MKYRVFSLLAFPALFLTSPGAVSTTLASTGQEAKVPPYTLKVVEDRVSLRVADGSVVALVEDLGRILGFEVIAQGVADERVSLDFENLSPGLAIRAICKGIGYVEVPDPETGRTVRIVLTPGGSAAKNRLAARREPLAPRPEPPPEEPPPVRPDPVDPDQDQKPPEQKDDDRRP